MPILDYNVIILGEKRADFQIPFESYLIELTRGQIGGGIAKSLYEKIKYFPEDEDTLFLNSSEEQLLDLLSESIFKNFLNTRIVSENKH